MSRIRIALVGTVAAGLLLMSVGVARADNVQVNDLTVAGDFTVNVDETADVSYQITANNGDSETGCNATPASPAYVNITVPPEVEILSPEQPMVFTACHNPSQDARQTVKFVSSTPGDYPIAVSVSDNGTGTYRNNANFTLHVVGPVDPPVEVDDVDPVIVAKDMVVEATMPSGAVVPSYDVTVTDNEDPSPQVTFAPVEGSTFALGSHTVTVTAVDAAGNTASATFTVLVQDTIAPVLSTPSSVSAYGWNGFFQPIDNGGVVNKAKAGQSIPVKFNLDGPATVIFTATATDAVDLTPTVICDHLSGSSFPQGVTTVNCTATDDSGNSSSASFDVTVLGGDLGNGIMYQGYPNFAIGDVPPANTTDGLEEYAASTPGLHYDAVAKQYVYVWATSKAWAGKSGTLRVKLSDGSMHTALFNFQK